MKLIPARLNFLNRVSFQEKLVFTKHLDTMIKAGIPLSDALVTVIEQSKSEKFRKIIKKILKDVENGQSLASSLKKHPQVFDNFYVSLVDVGEESGTLEESLDFLTEQLSKEYALRKKLQSAMFYPLLVIAATGIIGGLISFFVLPRLVEFFNSFEIELPLTTKILLFFANMVKNYGILIVAGLVLLIVVLFFVYKIPKVKFFFHKWILKVPVFGTMLGYGQLARFTRNLGTLIKTGVPVSRAIEITTNTLSNLKFKKDLSEVGKSLTKGKNIGDTLKSKDYFEYPPLVSQMIAIGEKTGKLDETLLYLGDFYEEEIDNISKNLTTIIEPALLIFIGIVVGFVALAIISPIYQLTGSIRR